MAKTKARKQGKQGQTKRGSTRQSAEAERAVSGTTTACQPPPGLVNLGNTCFMNATLQALASAPQMQNHFARLDTTNPACMGFKDWVVASIAAGDTRTGENQCMGCSVDLNTISHSTRQQKEAGCPQSTAFAHHHCITLSTV